MASIIRSQQTLVEPVSAGYVFLSAALSENAKCTMHGPRRRSAYCHLQPERAGSLAVKRLFDASFDITCWPVIFARVADGWLRCDWKLVSMLGNSLSNPCRNGTGPHSFSALVDGIAALELHHRLAPQLALLQGAAPSSPLQHNGASAM